MIGPPTVLVVEDDESLRVALVDNLEDEGYRVLSAESGDGVGELVDREAVDLVVLDVMLPGLDGYTVCRRLRRRRPQVRVLMLTARTLEGDLVEGFEAGADDYLTKPFRLRELLLRVAALLRRGGTASRTVDLAGFRLDLDARSLVDPAGREIHLTPTELDLLALFAAETGRALSRRRILDEVWGEEVVVDERTVDNFVWALKKKLGAAGGSGLRFETVRGYGYRFTVDGG